MKKKSRKSKRERWMSNDFKEGKARKEVNLGEFLVPYDLLYERR